MCLRALIQVRSVRSMSTLIMALLPESLGTASFCDLCESMHVYRHTHSDVLREKVLDISDALDIMSI